MNPLARRRFRKRVQRLDYPTAANLLQALAHAGYDDPRVLLILADHVWSICPNDDSAEVVRRWRDVFAQGRLVKFGAFPAEFRTFEDDDQDHELAAHIDKLIANLNNKNRGKP